MREGGLLVLVFGPLDELVQPTHPEFGAIVTFALSGLIFTVLGTIIEARR